MRTSSLLFLAATAVVATSLPALARGHGGGHHGGGHYGGFHVGHGHGGHGFGWAPRPGPRFVHVRHGWHPHGYGWGAPAYYVGGPRPVGGCTTSRHIGWTRYGWHKIVTTRTCIVP